MSFQAYQQAATRSEDPRSTEYRLFAQVTRALEAVLGEEDWKSLHLSVVQVLRDRNPNMVTTLIWSCRSSAWVRCGDRVRLADAGRSLGACFGGHR